MLEDILGETLEWQNWGLNVFIVSSFVTILFAFAEGFTVIKQARTIWKTRSGQSVSVIWFSYFGCFLVSFLVYGISIKGIAVIVDGFSGLIYFPVVWGLWRFKGFTRIEKLTWVGSLLMIPAMTLLPWKAWMLLIFSSGALVALATMPWEIWRNKSAGIVEISFVALLIINMSFWATYGYYVGDVALEVVTPIALFFLLITLVLWFKYRSSRAVYE